MTPDRQEQARVELGRTVVGRGAALALTLFLLVTVGQMPVVDLVLGDAAAAWAEWLSAVRSGAGRVVGGELRSGNDDLLAALDRIETRVEETSIVRQWALPGLQWFLTRGFGVGNEQAYLGRGGWLFYRADVDHVMGGGFLDPDRLEARRRSGKAWEAPVEPDPLPALERFERDLAARGITLVLLPVPVKPSIHPERFSARAVGVSGVLRNPSYSAFVERLEAARIEWIDPTAALEPVAAGAASYLATDTHWTPAAVERVAELVAQRMAARWGGELGAAIEGLERRAVRLRGRGDIAELLRLPEGSRLYPAETVEARRVLVDGEEWRPDPRGALLVLGDSFTNIYADPALGWGSGAGLAEQLSYALERPVDRLARNAGGPRAARESLVRSAERLAAKRVVLYQFATRELSDGDWPVLPLPPAVERPPEPGRTGR